MKALLSISGLVALSVPVFVGDAAPPAVAAPAPVGPQPDPGTVSRHDVPGVSTRARGVLIGGRAEPWAPGGPSGMRESVGRLDDRLAVIAAELSRIVTAAKART